MNETLFLTLLGFGLWLAVRAHRLDTSRSFAEAVIVLCVLSLTRKVGLPIILMAVFMLWLTGSENVDD